MLSSISLFCCCFEGLGIVLALPAFLIANKKLKDVALNPDEYDVDEIKAMNTAKTFALVTLVINGLYFTYTIYKVSTTDWDTFLNDFQQGIDAYQN